MDAYAVHHDTPSVSAYLLFKRLMITSVANPITCVTTSVMGISMSNRMIVMSFLNLT